MIENKRISDIFLSLLHAHKRIHLYLSMSFCLSIYAYLVENVISKKIALSHPIAYSIGNRDWGIIHAYYYHVFSLIWCILYYFLLISFFYYYWDVFHECLICILKRERKTIFSFFNFFTTYFMILWIVLEK